MDNDQKGCSACSAEEKISPEQNKRIEKQSIALLIILMLVLASFIAAYFLLKPKPYFEYNNLKVYPIKYEGSNLIFYSIPLNFYVDGKTFEKNVVIRNDPRAVENISSNLDNSTFEISGMGLTMDPSLSSRAVIAAQEIGKLSQTLSLPTFFGVTKAVEDKQADIFDCENHTETLKIVRMELGNETKVTGIEGCIIVTGENYDEMMKAADKVVVEWLKVIVK